MLAENRQAGKRIEKPRESSLPRAQMVQTKETVNGQCSTKICNSLSSHIVRMNMKLITYSKNNKSIIKIKVDNQYLPDIIYTGSSWSIVVSQLPLA